MGIDPEGVFSCCKFEEHFCNRNVQFLGCRARNIIYTTLQLYQKAHI